VKDSSYGEIVLEYNSQKPLNTFNGFGVQQKRVLSFFTCWKPLSTSNGFGVQLTKTISGFMQGA